MAETEQHQLQLKELASKLENPPASKDALITLLKQGATCLSEIDQSPPKPVMESMQPFLNAIAKSELLQHDDREIKLFVAACHCEITRITAPEAPYDDDVFKDIFQLIVSTFNGLEDINSPSFGRRLVILETLARYRSCVVMLDLECDDLIDEMFQTFFSVVRDEHSENVLISMQTIMEVLLEESEDVQENLLVTLLSVLGQKDEDITVAARKLVTNVIQDCAAKLEPGIKHFLMSSMSGESKSLKSNINYHGAIYQIYRCTPQILSGVVPYLVEELRSDQLDARLKAVGLVGDLFALPESTISEAFQPVFVEFLKRLTDRAAEVRMSALDHVKSCLLANPSRAEASQTIASLCDRLLDYDENVRKQVVSVICDVACHDLSSISVDTIKLVAERLRDKSVLVKTYAMERLADIYRASCANKSNASEMNDGYDWIVGKILRSLYDKDFRLEDIESTVSLSLFPTDFSAKDKMKNWVRIFSTFDKIEIKALEKILEQKQRLQMEMQKYLSLRQSPVEGDGTENQKKVTFQFRIMSRCFTDPATTEDNFHSLDQLKDANIWKLLALLLDSNTSTAEASSSRDELLKTLGQKHPLYEFLRYLSLKCSHLLFDKDHVREILVEAGVQKSSESNELTLSCMTILVILARFCPSLLVGIEEDLVHCLEDDNEIIKEGTLHILAKAGGTIREQLGLASRSLDLILERICIEGSRRQAKYAVHALASITKDDGLMSLSVLYKRLVDMLEEKSHLPAVLQSLGCIAQAATPVFETRESEVEKFIKENILKQGHTAVDKSTNCWDDRSELCSLKIFGVKALVKSFLPVKDAHLRSGIDDLIEILKNILSHGDISKDIESSLVDRAHLKLAAAKAVLRLSKHWEHKIPTEIFYLTLRTSEDNFPEVRRLLLNKIHQYVKDRILDPKYACAFLFDFSSQQSELDENKHNLNDIIQICRQWKTRQLASQTEASSSPVYPEYILPFVVHSLAHHPSFPNIDDKDVKSFEAMYSFLTALGALVYEKEHSEFSGIFFPVRQLYMFLSMMVSVDADAKSDISINKDKETISLLNSIFRCIKRSEDAFDPAKSKNSYALCELGLSIITRLSPKQNDIQESSASVTIPAELYKLHEKKEENGTVDEEKTWLAEEATLSHFSLLELEANGNGNEVAAEEDIMKGSDAEGTEVMPLAKLMKLIKAKARKEVKNKGTPARAAKENEVDILKMVKEINSDNPGTSKFESSNGHEHVHKKKRSDNKTQKRKSLFSGSINVPVPKRKRTSSTQAHKSRLASASLGKKFNAIVDNKPGKKEEEHESSSEGQSAKEGMEEALKSKAKSRSSSASKGKKLAISVDKRSGKKEEERGSSSEGQSAKENTEKAHKSHLASASKGKKLATSIEKKSGKKKEERASISEDRSAKENTKKAANDLLVSNTGKKSGSSSKQKGKRSDRDQEEILSDSQEAKNPKKLKGTQSAGTVGNSKSGSVNNKKRKSMGGLEKCSTKENGVAGADLIDCRIKVWWPMDKKFYEGLVKSFDTRKKKHVILYEDGDVEVLQLDRERWELVEKQSGSSKGARSKVGSSGGKKKLFGDKLEEKLSQVRAKRTSRKSSNKKQKKALESKSSKGSGGSSDAANHEADSEKEEIKRNDKMSDVEMSEKQEDAKSLSESERPNEEEKEDSEETQSDEVGGSKKEVDKSDKEVSSSVEKLPEGDKEESDQETDKDTPDKNKNASTSHSADEISDDEPLSAWKKRGGRK